MRKILFPFEKLLMLFFYVELMFPLRIAVFLSVSLLLLVLSIWREGAKPYTPLLLVIMLMELLNFHIATLIFVILSGLAMVVCKLYDINVPFKGIYLTGHRYLEVKSKN